VQSGGPGWGVLLGRLDGKTSSIAGAQNLPGPFDGLKNLTLKFQAVNLDVTDLVALSGIPLQQTSPTIIILVYENLF
jgi:peroxidase